VGYVYDMGDDEVMSVGLVKVGQRGQTEWHFEGFQQFSGYSIC